MDQLFAIRVKPVATRLNIVDFSTNPLYTIRWHLYLRALAKLQSAPPSDITGYYRLAAIHGWPLVTWPQGKSSQGRLLYCKHGTPTFLTWHRVYMLLFEEHILQIAMDLANRAPIAIRDDYTLEALQVRLPFWDWAANMALPAAALGRVTTVVIPEDNAPGDITTPTNIPNPLYSYVSTGLHHPSFQAETHRDDREAVAARFVQDGVRTTTYHALNAASYGLFSNANYPDANHSIEVPHDNVHDHTGGLGRIMNIGEMADAMVTGFDPIFWLHHASIDRLYALWQEKNLNALYEENTTTDSTIDSPLLPFSRAEPFGSWKSRMMQRASAADPIPDPYEYGVQYPETLSTMTPDQRRLAVLAAINSYAPPAVPGLPPPDAPGLPPPPPDAPGLPPPPPDAPGLPPPDAPGLPLLAAPGLPLLAAANELYPRGAVAPGERETLPGRPPNLPVIAAVRREWELLINYKNNLAPVNFTISVFLGKSGKDPLGWRNEEHFVGSISTFKIPVQHCKNCEDQEGKTVHAAVFLTDKVYDMLPPGIPGLAHVDLIGPWMAEKIDWRISLADGTEHKLSEENLGVISVRVVSYMEAYGPRDEQGNPIDCDLDKILGVTFDYQEHRAITRPKLAKGGQAPDLAVG